MLMFGGGHFAGWVISLRPKLVSGSKGGKGKEREVVVLESKTFHRYTSAFFSPSPFLRRPGRYD